MQLSLWNLRPALSAQFFRTTCNDWEPLEFPSVLPTTPQWFAFNEPANVLVVVVRRATEVNWGNFQNVFDTIYDLIILRWDKEAGALALYSSDYTLCGPNGWPRRSPTRIRSWSPAAHL